MSYGRRVSAAMVVAAAFIGCCVGVSTGPTRAGDDGAQFLLFSGADLWRDGRFMHGGLLWAPGGLDWGAKRTVTNLCSPISNYRPAS
jgi:hypothetical protein